MSSIDPASQIVVALCETTWRSLASLFRGLPAPPPLGCVRWGGKARDAQLRCQLHWYLFVLLPRSCGAALCCVDDRDGDDDDCFN